MHMTVPPCVLCSGLMTGMVVQGGVILLLYQELRQVGGDKILTNLEQHVDLRLFSRFSHWLSEENL